MSEDVLGDGISYIDLVESMPTENIFYYNNGETITSWDLKVLQAARISTGNMSGIDYNKDRKLIKYLIDNGHLTPFEHIQIAFRVKAPIFIARQWFRHRAFSYNEASARYQDKTDNAEFYIPENWRQQDGINNKQGSNGWHENSEDLQKQLQLFCTHGIHNYENAIKAGVAKEMARMFLPINMYTEFVVSGNLRNWLWNFCDQRSDLHAQEEIRVYSQYIEEIITRYAPITYLNYYNKKHGY